MAALSSSLASEVVVQKYGGSSLATGEQLHHVARRIGSVARSGRRVVAVVSARGNTTDDMIRLAKGVNPHPESRELDQLLATGETASASLMAMAIQRMGLPATALSGTQSGILATGPHGSGIIVAIDAEHILKLLNSGRIVVVAGFQGVTAEGGIITLGRGGSDTTAVAVAAELRARRCEIYTDVAGVFTADPRIVPTARVMPDIDIDVMAEMAFAGARVMHSRAVELADLYGLDIQVGHSAASEAGTRIHGAEASTRIHETDGEDMLEAKAVVMAVVHDPDVVRVTFRTTDTQDDPALAVFRILAQQTIPADMTAVSETPDGGRSIGLTVHHSHAAAVRRSFTDLAAPRQGGVEMDERVAKVSIVGKGLLSRPEYAARMLSSLTGSGIAARSLSASQLRVSVTVPSDEADRAVGLLHSEFGLDAEAGLASFHRTTVLDIDREH
jgi:aspartate kinase